MSIIPSAKSCFKTLAGALTGVSWLDILLRSINTGPRSKFLWHRGAENHAIGLSGLSEGGTPKYLGEKKKRN